jgi:hypothetical protein
MQSDTGTTMSILEAMRQLMEDIFFLFKLEAIDNRGMF